MSLKGTAALAAGLLLAGAAFDLPSLYVPGIALAALGLGAFAWVGLATAGARTERLAGPATVTEGQPYPVRVRVRGGLLPLRGKLVDPLCGEPRELRVPAQGTGAAATVIAVTARFTGRGRRQLPAARVVVGDPLGLWSRTLETEPGAELLVLPRVEEIAVTAERAGNGASRGTGSGDGAGAGSGGTAEVELDGLRPYRAGSPASRIHWPAVARHGELIERRLISGGNGSPLVVLDTRGPASVEALDRAIRAAASLTVHLARAGGCALLLPGAARPLVIDPQLRRWPQAHASLALVEADRGPAGSARTGAGASTFWVAADDGAAAARRLPRGSYLITPEPGRGRAAFEVAGCHARRIGGARARRRPLGAAA